MSSKEKHCQKWCGIRGVPAYQHCCVYRNRRLLQLQAAGLGNLVFGLTAIAVVSHPGHVPVQVWSYILGVSELQLFSSPQHFPSLAAPFNTLALVGPIPTLTTLLLCYMRALDPDLWALVEVSCCKAESKSPL